MAITTKTSATVLARIIKGMSSPADVFQIKKYRYPHLSEREALRGDWGRVGGDFKVVIERENGKTSAR